MLFDALKHFEINSEIEKIFFFEALKSCVKKIGERILVADGMVQWSQPFLNQGSITGIFFGMHFEALVELFPKAKKFIRNILKLTLDFL